MNTQERLVSIPKRDLESLEATIETLQNKHVMGQLVESEQDIREKKTKT